MFYFSSRKRIGDSDPNTAITDDSTQNSEHTTKEIEKVKVNKVIKVPNNEKRSVFVQRQAKLDEWKIHNAKAKIAIREGVREHHAALVRNINRSVKRNDYGVITEDHRDDALVEFLESININFLRYFYAPHKEYVTKVNGDPVIVDGNIVADISYTEAKEVVIEELKNIENRYLEKGFDLNSVPSDGHQFESWVATAMRTFGWDARITPPSGDQGIDVIAEIEGQTLGLQCKRYSQNVGNKAIQEALSGKVFYSLDNAAVISNANYTRSAKELAATCGILLLSPSDIPKLDQILRNNTF